jgi:hypothetical protein
MVLHYVLDEDSICSDIYVLHYVLDEGSICSDILHI